MKMSNKIVKRVSARTSGGWVCTPKDFLEVGRREAVDQALFSLVKAVRLRRASYGLYDMLRISNVLKRPAMVLGVVCVLLLSVSNASAQEIRVVDQTFCLEIRWHTCDRPAVTDEVRIDQLITDEEDKPLLYYWTSIETSEDIHITHVWAAADRKDPWAEKIHISLTDRIKAGVAEVVKVVRNMLIIIYEKDPSVHSVQGVVLSIDRSPRFRTRSSITAKPGTYFVEVRDYNGDIIENGETRKITILE